MIVSELILALQGQDQNAKVIINDDHGNFGELSKITSHIDDEFFGSIVILNHDESATR